MDNRTVGVGTLKLNGKAKKYINQVIDSNRLSYGPFCQRLEKDFARIHDSKFAVVSNSGTSSLQVALQTLKEIHGWHDGDEVIVPAITFIATSNIVIHNRMKPVFVDVEREYYCIDHTKIEAAITTKTKAIIPVHMFGMPCDMDPVIKIAKKYNLKVIEDSCETMFARYKGMSVGNLGHIGCFSTYVAHLLTTGVGGIAITNNPEYAIKMRSLVNHGRDSIYLSLEDDDNKSAEELKEIIAKRFSFIDVGHSFRITEMEAALGVAQLEEWEDMIKKRKKNAHYLINGLKDLEEHIQLPKIRPETDHSFMLFPIVLKNQPKEKLVNFIEGEGIETRDMMPITNQPVYKRLFSIKEEEYPVARWINNNGFYIGCHQNLSKDDLDYVISIFHKFFRIKKG